MQVFRRLLSRALTKFGTAIAIKIPMINTTIMISTSVKALFFLIFFPPKIKESQAQKKSGLCNDS
jgi:hypothetical protein